MAKGTVYGSERALLRDARSGLQVIRLTHGPCISTNLYIEMCSFTSDDVYVIIRSQRYAGRDAPSDVFRAKTDGMELVQVTGGHDAGAGCVVVTPATDSLFYQDGRDLKRVAIHSLKEETVAELPGAEPCTPESLATMDRTGRWLFCSVRQENGRAGLCRVDVTNGAVEVIHESTMHGHLHVDPSGRLLCFGDYDGEVGKPRCIDADGGNLRDTDATRFAHWTWIGDDFGVQGTLVPPGNAVVTRHGLDEDPVPLTTGRYYWHSGPSLDGEWIISDTNWPQEGLYLIHVPTGSANYVCDTRSIGSHPQWTHPHPSLSPGMRYAQYNSDMTGIGQVYLAELTEDFLQQASKGYIIRTDLL